MQTQINVAQAFGMAGEMYDLTPRRVDAVEVDTDVTIGNTAGISADGKIGAKDATTYTTFAGIFVRPKESINYGGSDGALSPSMEVPAGCTVQVCSMGRVKIVAPSDAVAGAPIYVYPEGGYTLTTGGTTEIGKVIVGGKSGEIIVIEIG